MSENLTTPFETAIQALFSSGNSIQKKAWDRFCSMGLPKNRDEMFQYVRLRDLYNRSFLPFSCAEPPKEPLPGLVFVNGVYRKEFSTFPEGVIALPLTEAMTTYSTFLQNRLETLLEEEKDPFALLNLALFSEGLFLYIPPKKVLEAPLSLFYYMDPSESQVAAFPRVHLFVGKEASVTLECSMAGSMNNSWQNSVLDLVLDEQSQCTLQFTSHEIPSSWHLEAIRASLKRNSSLKTVSANRGGATSRQDYHVQLVGEGAEASLFGVWHLTEKSHHHVHVLMEHKAPYSRSNQTFKGALTGTSRSSFEGKIYVHREAQKTEAYQLNSNLLLDRKASANSKPNLEIFADDVKASHGATVGQLDPDSLFYLKTRGIPESQAKRMLVEGFLLEIFDHFSSPHFKQKAYDNFFRPA
ncbi:MAG: FeS cluster assembly protein SufD [Chlamydiae bacterium]|nr:FeS cluster assembly protein SufD [Chlamydiota bacterium]